MRVGLPLRLAVSASSGVALTLALPPADLGPVAFVALVPLLWAVRGSRARRGALLGLVFGIVYFAIQMSWLTPLTKVGWAVLSLSVGGWMALLFGFVAAVWREEAPVRTAFVVGAAWAALEWVRTAWPFGGVTWAGLGYTQHDNPLMLPLASVTGVLGISFVVAAANVLALFVLTGPRARLGRLGLAAGMAAAPVLIPLAEPRGLSVDVAIVQGNVPERIAARSRIIEDQIVADNHDRLNRTLAGDPPDLVVWPENALDQDPLTEPGLGAQVAASVRAVGAPTLIGAITDAPGGRELNESLLFDADGALAGRYAKNHLLPFGEYIPFRRSLSWIPDVALVPRDLSPGDEPGRLRVRAGAFAAVICFENVFPSLVREFTTEETGFIVVSTNNSSFLRTAAAAQHLAHSELRAVENGRWVVHAALSGISAVVDPRGRVHRETGLFEPAVVRARVPQATGRTIYNRVGHVVPPLLLLGVAAGWLGPRRARRRSGAPLPEDPRVAVVLPTYDERETVEEVVRGVLAVGERVEVVVVDDASPDGTAEVVRRLTEETRRVALLERPGKGGLASAYGDGFRRALGEGFDVVVEMDADLSHRPGELPRLLEGARRFDLTIGSRYAPGGSVTNWGPGRRLLSRAGNRYARTLLGFPVRDATSGYRAFRAAALRELLEHAVRTDGYGFQIELAYRAWRAGLSVGEVPITFQERRAGASKMSRRIVVEALWRVAAWALRDRLFRRPAPLYRAEASRL